MYYRPFWDMNSRECPHTGVRTFSGVCLSLMRKAAGDSLLRRVHNNRMQDMFLFTAHLHQRLPWDIYNLFCFVSVTCSKTLSTHHCCCMWAQKLQSLWRVYIFIRTLFTPPDNYLDLQFTVYSLFSSPWQRSSTPVPGTLLSVDSKVIGTWSQEQLL